MGGKHHIEKWPKFNRPEWVSEVVEWKKRTLKRWKENLPQKPDVLTSMAAYALLIAIFKYVSNPNRSDFLDSLYFSHFSRTWHYHGHFNEGKHSISLPGIQPFDFDGKLPANMDLNHHNLMQGAALSIILRDQNALSVYEKIPFNSFAKGGPINQKPYLKPYSEFLRSLDKSSSDSREILERAESLNFEIRKEKPAVEPGNNRDYILLLEIRLWQKFREGSSEAFNSALQSLIRAYKAYHEQLPNGKNEMLYYLPLSIIAPVCYAYDQGMKIEVKSDYLPEFLIEGDFPKVQWPELPHP